MNKEKLATFAVIVKNRFKGAEVGSTSVMVAYYLLLSVFPLLVVVGNVLALFNIDPVKLLDYAALVVPEALMPVLTPLVVSLLGQASGSLISIGVLAGLWSASRVVGFLQKSMDKTYGIRGSGYLVKRVVSFVTVLLVMALLVAFLLVYSIGDMVLAGLAPHAPWASNLLGYLKGLKWPVAVGFLFALLVLVYRVTPDVKLRVRHILPGAAFGTAGLLALVQAFAVYIQFSARTFSSYGAISTVFVLMFWLKYTATIVILGAVLNASIAEYRFGEAEYAHGGINEVILKTQNSVLGRLQQWYERRKAKKAQSGDEKEDL